MTTLPVILVAVHGSDACMQAATYIIRMLSPNEAGIEPFHVRAEAPESLFDPSGVEGSLVYETEIGDWIDRHVPVDVTP